MTRNAEPSPAILAAELEIARTRKQLDAALVDLRREMSLPLAAIEMGAALLDQGPAKPSLGRLLRRYAMPIALAGVGAGWAIFRGKHPLHSMMQKFAVSRGPDQSASEPRIGDGPVANDPER